MPKPIQEYCKFLWRESQYAELHRVLVREVAMHYWKFSAELYALFGYLGLSAGIGLDWDESSFWPPMAADAERRLFAFLAALTDKRIPLALNTRARKLMTVVREKRCKYGNAVCWIPYQRIVMTRSDYEIGGARIFLEFLQTNEWEIGVAGLLAIYTEGLDRAAIGADMALRRRGRMK